MWLYGYYRWRPVNRVGFFYYIKSNIKNWDFSFALYKGFDFDEPSENCDIALKKDGKLWWKKIAKAYARDFHLAGDLKGGRCYVVHVFFRSKAYQATKLVFNWRLTFLIDWKKFRLEIVTEPGTRVFTNFD